MEDLQKLYDFFEFTEKLKKVIRYNAQDEKFHEDTASHSWQVIMMTFVTAKELNLNLDLFHAIKIAMVHDLPEIIAGDVDNTLVFSGDASATEKEDEEVIAMKKISQMVSPDLGKELFALWEEYNLAKTKEARFVKAMDKLEGMTHKFSTSGEDPAILHTVQYADKAVSNFEELKPLLGFFKDKFKVKFEIQGVEWKEEYENVLRK